MRAPIHARPALAATLGAAVVGLVAGCGGGSTSTSSAAGSVNTAASATTAATATSAASTAAASGSAITLHLATASAEPTAARYWPIVVTATPKVNGIVSYTFLFNGSVVSHQPGGPMRNGVYHDRLLFPARAEGVPLTLEVVLKTADGRSADVQRPVTTSK